MYRQQEAVCWLFWVIMMCCCLPVAPKACGGSCLSICKPERWSLHKLRFPFFFFPNILLHFFSLLFLLVCNGDDGPAIVTALIQSATWPLPGKTASWVTLAIEKDWWIHIGHLQVDNLSFLPMFWQWSECHYINKCRFLGNLMEEKGWRNSSILHFIAFLIMFLWSWHYFLAFPSIHIW